MALVACRLSLVVDCYMNRDTARGSLFECFSAGDSLLTSP
jgi:hypothetical protein